ncbi:MAG TPA: glucosyl-3-phosphoglycerate synthase [Solirubrobacteraceae bacterium]|jgi:glucosyl-3-phosphoglycerate synthase|nr:glucosyl-3-phosphoglycerate synthase [Solirubrobacteraceae bacterium]
MSATAAQRWAEARSFHHSRYPAQRIAAERRHSVSVCLPARECADTVGQIVRELVTLREAKAIDEIVVVDAASADGTAAVAERAGARVLQEAELLPEQGPVLGKGDAMWRALSALDGELVCFLDADTEAFSAHFATGLLGPLVCEPGVSFVKAFYRRPFGEQGQVPEGGGACDGGGGGGASDGDGGGRVNQLTARPALALFYPELACVRQPLAGEVAARRDLLESLPFITGYGVEIGMLIDAWRKVGLQAMAQVDLDEHRHHHQPLSALASMALTVLATIASRLELDETLEQWPERFGLEDEIDMERLEEFDPKPVARPPLAALGLARTSK